MVEVEIYAAGVRSPDKIMALGLELDSIPGIRYKVDTNHDIVYMEFDEQAPALASLKSLFHRAGLPAKFVGTLPPELNSEKKKTQRLDA